MIIKHFKDYINNLNEGLIKTYNGDLVLKNILSQLILFKLNVGGEFIDNKIKLTINNFNTIPLNQIENIFDQIYVSVVNNGGWFPASMVLNRLSGITDNDKYDFIKIINIHDGLKSLTILFESKFDTIDYDIPDKLYHLTIKEYSKKINKYGLIPRSKSKLTTHLDRIYVCKNYKDCLDLIPKMMFYYTGEKDENIYKLGKKLFNKDLTPIVYEIDNSNNFITNLYVDINYGEKGYYILENVPPDRIKIVDNI
jgi:hypothetical protein